jgi:uncharacterized protein YbjT (DUF2867 family)
MRPSQVAVKVPVAIRCANVRAAWDPTDRTKGALDMASKRRTIVIRSSLISAFERAYGVYGVTTMLSPKGKLIEREQGTNIADACIANGVEHLVLSTIPSIGDQVFVPYIRSKLDIEEYVRGRDLPFTFLGPGSFMDEIGGSTFP